MNYGAAEQEIVDRLNTQIAANNVADLYEAVLMPETTADFRDFYAKFTKARAAVQFVESIPQPTNATGPVTQEETVRFRISFEAKKLRGAGGLYALFDLVKLVLIGFRLTNAFTRLTFAKYALQEYEQGAWQPYFEFECNCANVQSFDDYSIEPDLGPPITVTFGADILG